MNAGLARLTPRELDVANLVACGFSNRKIALTMKIAESTVKTRLSHIFDKLGFSNRVELALFIQHHREDNAC